MAARAPTEDEVLDLLCQYHGSEWRFFLDTDALVHHMQPMTTLYRAAKDDYLERGCCFAETIETARMYQANPGFGGASLYVVETEAKALDLRGMSVREVADQLGLVDPIAISVDEWIPRSIAAQSAIRGLGYSWALVSESYPEGTTTWIWVGDSCDEPELTEVQA